MDVVGRLASYGASRVSWVDAAGREHASTGDGGGLEHGYDRHGRGPLLALLAEGLSSVTLEDGALSIRAERVASGARVVIAWGDDVVAHDAVELPALSPRELQEALDTPGVSLIARGVPPRWHRGRPDGDAVAWVPPCGPEDLGSADFRADHGVKWAYVAGAMAGGIASADLVVAMQRAGLLAFFGSGGLPLDAVDAALLDIQGRVDGANWGANLLHNPAEPDVEERTVDLYLARGVRNVSASAYVKLTPAVVRYRVCGLREGADGRVHADHRVFAKVSRREVADAFLAPPPAAIVAELVARGAITETQARLAARVPMADDVTAEGDSGGHTDHRPLLVLLGELLQRRDRAWREHGYATRPRIGAAGGLGTPLAVWAAFAAGADYVLTGSVNQASVEAGTSRAVKELLAAASPTDVASGPAPDMFELGAKVQVLSRGSMYAQRAQRLYDTYRAYPSLEAIPLDLRGKLEKQIFRRPLSEVWADTRAYWAARDPTQLARAEDNPRHRMALTFRWYLGFTSRWARTGDPDRVRDYQVWCGPAMGAFNAWAAGGPLEDLDARGVVAIAEALMTGAAVHQRRYLAGNPAGSGWRG